MTLDNKCYKVLGLMSGTSLDGLDIAYCEFQKVKDRWNFDILHASTIEYPNLLKDKLQKAMNISGLKLSLLNNELGQYFGTKAIEFMIEFGVKPDFISSHGHTVFHQPNKGLTLQIGSGTEIAAKTGLKTICDFRTKDVALGGQGAPLVPIGDQLLFIDYDACLNLGGFANISFNFKGDRIAFDVCPFNIVANYFMQKHGKNYDDKGRLGNSGSLNTKLLNSWNNLEFYKQTGPKSLGWEFVQAQILPQIQPDCELPDILKTYYEHISDQIAKILNKYKLNKVLITGGGVYNTYVMELLKSKTRSQITIPNKTLVEYKEALIFAFLGVLRLRNENNILKSVTGASQDHVGGVVYY